MFPRVTFKRRAHSDQSAPEQVVEPEQVPVCGVRQRALGRQAHVSRELFTLAPVVNSSLWPAGTFDGTGPDAVRPGNAFVELPHYRAKDAAVDAGADSAFNAAIARAVSTAT